MRFDILSYDGVDELDVVGPWEVLRAAADVGAEADVRLVRHDSSEPVVASYGMALAPVEVWEPGAADVLIVPGGRWAARGPGGAWGQVAQGAILPELRQARRGGTVVIAAVCTGSMILAHAGLLDGRRATTHHTALSDLAEFDVEIVDARVVDDGDVVTCGGVTSGIDLALALVRRSFGDDLADQVAARLEYPPPA